MKSVNIVYLLCATIVIAGCSFVAKQDARQQAALEQALAGETVSIPAGTFRMGDLSGEGWDDEQPVRSVTVLAFKLGKHEVTVGRFRAFVAATGYRTDAEQSADGYAGCVSEQSEGNWDYVPGRSWRDPGYPVEDDQPVACVGWNDAQAFINWLNEKAGGNFRLPSEAEWEYAARAGSTTEYYFGDSESELCRYANHADRSTDFDWRNESCSDGVGKRAAVVGSYQPNSFGLYDMHGNVWEWVQDCWNDSYEGAPTDGSAWTSGDCSRRVGRGGGWSGRAWSLRSAYRGWDDRAGRSSDVGFRLAQDK